jgi:hypothetical protein
MFADLLQAAAKIATASKSMTGVALGIVPVATLADGTIYLSSLQILLDPVTLLCKRCTLPEAVDLVMKQNPPESGVADPGGFETDETDD